MSVKANIIYAYQFIPLFRHLCTVDPEYFSTQNVGNVNDIFKSVTLLKTDRQKVHLLYIILSTTASS
jgi:hypothetical protein